MAVNLSPIGGVAGQFFDNNGNPLAGGKIFTYAAGTTTNQATYTSASGIIAHSNPIILDAAGRVPSGEIWLTDGLSYKFVIKTSTDVLIGTYDNIVGINSNFINFLTETEIQTATAGQTVFTLTTMDYQPGTNSLSVFVDGVNQYDGVTYAYTETSSTVVTFTAGLHVGALVKFTTAQTLSSGVTDASLVTYDPPFTGSVPTNVELKLAETVSVKDFGAVGDGVTDDTAAFNLVAAYANNNSCSVYIPTGTYELNGKITFTQSVSLRGDGKDLSKLVWDQSAGSVGIEIQLQSQSDCPTVSGIGFIRTGATVGATGTALKVMLMETGLFLAPLPQLTLTDCEAKNNSKNEHTFAIGFHLDDLRGAYVANVAYRGSFSEAAPTVMYGIGINVTGAENPYTVQMQGITVNRANIAVNVVESEGTYLSQFDFVGCNTGLKFRTNTPGTARQPQLTIANGHMNSYDYGLDIQDSAQSVICNVNSYKRSDSTATFIHVKLDRCLYMTVYGWLFEDGNLGVGTSTGIYLQNCQHTAIGINNYQTATTGIYVDANCAKTTIQEQRFNFVNVTTGIVNLGILTMLPAANTTVQTTSNLSIANSTTVGVTWNSIYSGNQTDNWVISAPTQLKAPDEGWYIFSYNIKFDTNATGYRTASVAINNLSPAKPNSVSLQLGTALIETALTGTTGPVYLNANDYATLNVVQTSGGALNLLSGATMSIWRIA